MFSEALRCAQFLGACVTPNETMLVTEVMEGGSLHALLRSRSITWWRGCASALCVWRHCCREPSWLLRGRLCLLVTCICGQAYASRHATVIAHEGS